MIKSIERQPRWFEGLQRRAERYGTDIDTALYQEADNVIKAQPASYLTALKDSIPTKRSTKAQKYYGIQ